MAPIPPCRRRHTPNQGNETWISNCPACGAEQSLLISTCADSDCSEVVAECATGCHFDDIKTALFGSADPQAEG